MHDMRHFIALVEGAKLHRVDGERVWENPSASVVQGLMRTMRYLRGFVSSDGDVFVWNAMKATHYDMEWDLHRAGLLGVVGTNTEFVCARQGAEFAREEFDGWRNDNSFTHAGITVMSREPIHSTWFLRAFRS